MYIIYIYIYLCVGVLRNIFYAAYKSCNQPSCQPAIQLQGTVELIARAVDQALLPGIGPLFVLAPWRRKLSEANGSGLLMLHGGELRCYPLVNHRNMVVLWDLMGCTFW